MMRCWLDWSAKRATRVFLLIRSMPTRSGRQSWTACPRQKRLPLWEAIRKTDVPAIIALQRTRQMKRIAKFAVAATILVVLGIAVFWITIGSSTSVAFARVAEALDSLKSATFDVTEETRGDEGQPRVIATGKGFFLAPSHSEWRFCTILPRRQERWL